MVVKNVFASINKFKMIKYLIIISCLYCQLVSAQKVQFTTAVFKTGDSTLWAPQSFNDKAWKPIALQTYWEEQGYDKYDGFAWYRIHFNLSSSLKDKAALQDLMEVFFSGIEDADITYLNGTEIGRTGRMPEDQGGFRSGGKNHERHYILKADLPALHWDNDNVLAIRVYDGGANGGIVSAQSFIRFLEPVDYISMDAHNSEFIIKDKSVSKEITFQNRYSKNLEGVLTTTLNYNDSLVKKQVQPVSLLPGKNKISVTGLASEEAATVNFVFKENIKDSILQSIQDVPYILTPKEKIEPKIHSSSAFGCRPGVPFLFSIATTGERPMQFEITDLPKGLKHDAAKGIISGKVEKEGTYRIKVTAINKSGKDQKIITLIIGNKNVIVTPPMGWNSWNCWGLSVSSEKVKSSADAMISSGLANHGWSYMNIDDGWESSERADNGSIRANEKFPDMKLLGDYLHSHGLKFGIYSSPGPKTCGGYLGSYQNEESDAKSYASWGVDYLKYDLCSYRRYFPKGILTLEELKVPYLKMYRELESSGRNIVYSLCEYGVWDVWKWGNQVGGNIWRTTGDISDNWISLKEIGFSQEVPASYNGSNYGFGDPDMLIVGYVGWGDNLRLTRLTPSEQYTHISLWCLLSAPLMLGCDLARMDPFTYNLLSNDEVLAIDQDVAGKGPKKIELPNDIELWVKDLADGTKAIGLFNLGDKLLKKSFKLSELGFANAKTVRDVWRQKNLPNRDEIEVNIPSHGVMLLKIVNK